MSVPKHIRLDVTLQDGDDLELEQAVVRLQSELRRLPIDSVERVTAGEAPPGAKAADLAVAAALVVDVGQSLDAVKALASEIARWVSRPRGRTVRVTLGTDMFELDHATPNQQQELVDAWLALHDSHS
jgi:hypothetical protein